MFIVYECRYGARMIANGPLSGCLTPEGWETVGVAQYRKKQDAIDHADRSETLAKVTKGHTSQVIYSNEKQPLARDPKYPARTTPEVRA